MPVKILSGNQTVPFFAEAHRYAAETKENISLTKVEGGHNFMQEYVNDSYQAAKEALEQFSYELASSWAGSTLNFADQMDVRLASFLCADMKVSGSSTSVDHNSRS